MAAKSRLVFDQEDKVWSASSLRVTDYKHNSRVIFPPALPLVQESKLEMLRGELLHQYREWMKEFCDDKGNQESNLSAQQKVGLSSIRKRIKEGEKVVLPTDKTGRFADSRGS